MLLFSKERALESDTRSFINASKHLQSAIASLGSELRDVELKVGEVVKQLNHCEGEKKVHLSQLTKMRQEQQGAWDDVNRASSEREELRAKYERLAINVIEIIPSTG